MNRCPNCNKLFTPLSVNHRFCSSKCSNQWYRNHKHDREQFYKAWYPKLDLVCPQCKKSFQTDGTPKDKRTRFCCKECEKKWWRKPPYEHESTRQNFRSLQEYISWERRTNQ